MQERKPIKYDTLKTFDFFVPPLSTSVHDENTPLHELVSLDINTRLAIPSTTMNFMNQPERDHFTTKNNKFYSASTGQVIQAELNRASHEYVKRGSSKAQTGKNM